MLLCKFLCKGYSYVVSARAFIYSAEWRSPLTTPGKKVVGPFTVRGTAPREVVPPSCGASVSGDRGGARRGRASLPVGLSGGRAQPRGCRRVLPRLGSGGVNRRPASAMANRAPTEGRPRDRRRGPSHTGGDGRALVIYIHVKARPPRKGRITSLSHHHHHHFHLVLSQLYFVARSWLFVWF